ncbi:hypothetical protein PI125_g7531 [Phytophthora idaei]|nr:hypothetical protein PI125_g7531 [Phytophthora idaei]
MRAGCATRLPATTSASRVSHEQDEEDKMQDEGRQQRSLSSDYKHQLSSGKCGIATYNDDIHRQLGCHRSSSTDDGQCILQLLANYHSRVENIELLDLTDAIIVAGSKGYCDTFNILLWERIIAVHGTLCDGPPKTRDVLLKAAAAAENGYHDIVNCVVEQVVDDKVTFHTDTTSTPGSRKFYKAPQSMVI